MIIPDEFMPLALLKKVDIVIMDAPPKTRILCKTCRITLESNPKAARRKYGIVNVHKVTYKTIEELTDKDVQRAGHQSKNDFLSWWEMRKPEYSLNGRIALVEFEMVAIEKFGLRLLESDE
jgi:hypothetical protein